ncbi:myeloid-associated differentiation marker-like protein 2 [Betta splendens]|uniref:Myeloid-associated differentiation marker-like protein 2 n=1 Tax=Betta splendens TaxID=158456 RepID=A0A6P7L4V4_BETSP|nr:myeloid-associated differentiation marker-like protein 2 [Betta splendens]
MCGPFKGCQGVLRLLEVLFSALALAVVVFRGRMLSPWGVWCEFVWVLCVAVPLAAAVMEARLWHVLLAACLPDWADLTCGLTALCAAAVASATAVFAAVFVCLSCVDSILCFIFSLVATLVFLFDSVRGRAAGPSGYLCSLRGSLRTAEAFVASVVLTAAADHFVNGNWAFRPAGMICSAVAFAVCLVVTVVVEVLNLLKLLQSLLSFGLDVVERVFNVVAVLLHLLAVILWVVFGYKRKKYDPYICEKCRYADVNTVTIGAAVNLVLYIIDLALSFRSH